MRKFLFLVFFMATAVFVFSQNTGITSVFNDISEGVFTNELDAAVSVDGNKSSGPDFRILTHDYLFTGITNLELSYFTNDATFSSTSPLWAGFYKAGDKPWSVFGAFGASGVTGNASDSTTYTQGATYSATTGTDTTVYQWNDSSSTRNYTANRIFDALNLYGQYLFTLDKMNTGVFVHMYLTNSDPQTANFEQNDVYYYDAAGGTAVPDPQLDYKYTRTRTSRDNTSEFTVAVPLYIPDSGSSQLFNFNAYFGVTDKSATDTESYSGTPNSALALTTTTVANDITARHFTGELDIDYTYKGNKLWGNSPKDQFWIKGTGDFTLSGGTYETSNITQDISAAGSGAAIVNGARSDTQVTFDGVPGFIATADAGVGHSFYFNLGSGVEFGLKPETTLEYSLILPVTVNSKTTVAKTDGDADGKFDSAADTITTTTVTYTNTQFDTLTGATASASTTNSISCTVELPVSVTFTPKGWPVTFILGSKPSISSTMTFTSTKTSTTSTTVSVADGTGTVTSTTVTNAVTADESSTMSTSYSVSATHNIGFFMFINDAVRMDVNLDAFSGIGPVNNIFDFGDLTAQVIIALP